MINKSVVYPVTPRLNDYDYLIPPHYFGDPVLRCPYTVQFYEQRNEAASPSSEFIRQI